MVRDGPRHEAHFYADEEMHLEEVAAHAAAGMGAHGAAVLIATGDHLHRVRQGLERLGVDPTSALEQETLVELDAAAFLSDVVVAGAFDETRFRGALEPLVARVPAPGPVHVYSETAALLWEGGDPDVALALEEAAGTLEAPGGVAVLCGYPGAVADPDHLDALVRACRLHGEVRRDRDLRWRHDTPMRISWPLEAAVSAPREARALAAGALAPFVDGSVLDDTAVVVSELVTNAVLHGEPPLRFTVRCDRELVRIEVTDVGPRLPRRVTREVLSVAHRGLDLVERLSASWGVAHDAPGKRVWAAIPTRTTT